MKEGKEGMGVGKAKKHSEEGKEERQSVGEAVYSEVILVRHRRHAKGREFRKGNRQ